MKLNEHYLESLHKARRREEVGSLVLDSLNLTAVGALEKYAQLQFLSLRFNQIQSVAFAAGCPRLWVLDLQQNNIADLAPLSTLGALGFLSCTVSTASSLAPLRSLHVVDCLIFSSSTKRGELLKWLPRVWILNGKYVTARERATVPELGMIVETTAKSAAFLSDPHKKLFFTELGEDPTSAPDARKLSYAVHDLDYRCELDWNRGGDVQEGRVKLRFPVFQLQRWTSLSRSSQVILSTFLCLYFEGIVSGKVLGSITTSIINDAYGVDELPLEAQGLCQLPPHFLLGLLIELRERLSHSSSIKSKPPGSQFEDNIEKLMESIDAEFVIENYSELIQRLPQSPKLFNLSGAPGPFTAQGLEERTVSKLLCDVGVNILKLYGLFNSFSTTKEMHHVFPLLDSAGLIRHRSPSPEHANITHKHTDPETQVKLVIRTPEDSPALNVVSKNTGTTPLSKCVLKSYEMGLPEEEKLQKNKSQQLHKTLKQFAHTVSRQKMVQPSLSSTKCKAGWVSRTPNARIRTAMESRSKAALQCSPINIMENDNSYQPLFLLSSQKPRLTPVWTQDKLPNWSVIGSNPRCLCYNESSAGPEGLQIPSFASPLRPASKQALPAPPNPHAGFFLTATSGLCQEPSAQRPMQTVKTSVPSFLKSSHPEFRQTQYRNYKKNMWYFVPDSRSQVVSTSGNESSIVEEILNRETFFDQHLDYFLKKEADILNARMEKRRLSRKLHRVRLDKAITHLRNVKHTVDLKDHYTRIQTREHTPWVHYNFKPPKIIKDLKQMNRNPED